MAGVYGHLDVDGMRAGLEQLGFQPSEAPVAEVLPLAVGGPHGAPVVRSSGNETSPSRASEENPEARGGVRGGWALLDSNQGPIGYEPTALTAELRAPKVRTDGAEAPH